MAFSYSSARAQQQTRLLPTDDGTVVDEFPFDGIANDLESDFVVIELNDFEPVAETIGDRRGVVEFDVSSLAGRSIRRAVLELTPSFIPVPEGTFVVPIEVRKYQGNGAVNLRDFYRGTFVTTFDMRSLRLGQHTSLNVTGSVRNALSHQWTYLGFVLRTNISPSGVSFGSLEHGPSPNLLITFND